jgi:hypothetical protein
MKTQVASIGHMYVRRVLRVRSGYLSALTFAVGNAYRVVLGNVVT